VSGIAYQVKAQTVIVFIAIMLYEGVCWLARVKRIGRKDVRAGLMIVIPLVACMLAPKVLPLKWERTFGMEHYLMMGMNPTSQGVYSDEDVAFSASYKTKAERKQAEWSVIRERLHDYGVAGWLRLAQTKLLTVYGDGTYAWGHEGTYFYAQVPEEKNQGLSPFLRSLYYRGGTRYKYFCAYAQMCWLVILVGTLCSGFVGRGQPNKKEEKESLYPLWLTVIGITLFEVLFESRARYLYTLTPLFLILAVMGYRNVWQRITTALAHKTQNREALASGK
jgi:hypothetical protein